MSRCKCCWVGVLHMWCTPACMISRLFPACESTQLGTAVIECPKTCCRVLNKLSPTSGAGAGGADAGPEPHALARTQPVDSRSVPLPLLSLSLLLILCCCLLAVATAPTQAWSIV